LRGQQVVPDETAGNVPDSRELPISLTAAGRRKGSLAGLTWNRSAPNKKGNSNNAQALKSI
jgi:hypothetical protein